MTTTVLQTLTESFWMVNSSKFDRVFFFAFVSLSLSAFSVTAMLYMFCKVRTPTAALYLVTQAAPVQSDILSFENQYPTSTSQSPLLPIATTCFFLKIYP